MRASGLALLGLAFLAAPAHPCILDTTLNASSPAFPYMFPNWQKAQVVAFDTLWCNSTDCAGFNDATIQGLTLFNYGTANGTTDITNVYTCFGCSRASLGACTPTQTLTYAGLWTVNGGADTYPAWTWDGPLALNADPCNAGPGGCACIFVMRVFVDIGPCPNDKVTVKMGPGYNDWDGGGIIDDYYCSAPWSALADPADKTIVFAVKTVDLEQAAPGDTLTYTIYYGRPGTTNLTNVTVFDTQPGYTHYLAGMGAPLPDGGWDPDPGPPLRLKWTIPPPHPVNGGPSGQVTFKLTVDWGNGESFEPGSGDIAGPEGYRLNNYSQVAFGGVTGCGTTAVVTDPAQTTIVRFLFWKIGDNDVLFSPSYGQSPDEMIYSVFVKNVSTLKTWWDVRIWDSVPPELDPWQPGFGFEDPCSGWTMSPSGCAAASPGVKVTGTTTLLTWKLDMPPGMTLNVRWKAQVKPSVTSGSTAVNVAAIQEMGRVNIAQGTGSSVVPRRFAHLAPIVLPTTYISYCGFGASDDDKSCPGFVVFFSPLNKKTQFEFRGLEYINVPFSIGGGVSASIGSLIGDCLGGFPGGGGISGGGNGGCKVERTPALYKPVAWSAPLGGGCPAEPFDFLYKLTSNSPVLWQLLTLVLESNQDNHTFVPSTALSYSGLLHYGFRRYDMQQPTTAGYGDSWVVMSTGMDPWGVYRAGLETTVHLFKWNSAILQWDYRRTFSLAPESVGVSLGNVQSEEGPWMSMSSDSKVIIGHEMNTFNTLGCCCGQCSDNHGAFMPTRETGNVVSGIGSGTFFGIANSYNDTEKVVIGNTGAATASWRIWKYVPDNKLATPPMPSMMNGSSGSWVPAMMDGCGAGLLAPDNPQKYGAAFNASSTAVYKVEVLQGGPIQVLAGCRTFSQWGGGAVMHASNGSQTGQEYWLHHVQGGQECTQVVNIFCPKFGQAVRCVSSAGYSAAYTTTGPDQCIAFRSFTVPTAAEGGRINYRWNVLTTGGVVAQFIACKITEKGYTAPFLQNGVHYIFITPPVVYAGTSFWITVVVQEAGGDTKTDYCGTTTFTSTDPSTRIEATPMGAFDYVWDSNEATATCKGAGCVGTCDNGVKMFFNLTLNKLGLQTIVAVDIQDGSITGVTALQVVGADVKLWKEPKLSIAASSDTVRFKVCWSNYSSASAFTFIVTDAVPVGTSYVPEAAVANLFCGSTDNLAVTVSYSTLASPTVPIATSFITGNPVAGTRWLRWSVPYAGVETTACACFRVVVN